MLWKGAQKIIKKAESLIWPRDGNGVGRKVNKQWTLELPAIHHVVDGKTREAENCDGWKPYNHSIDGLKATKAAYWASTPSPRIFWSIIHLRLRVISESNDWKGFCVTRRLRARVWTSHRSKSIEIPTKVPPRATSFVDSLAFREVRCHLWKPEWRQLVRK